MTEERQRPNDYTSERKGEWREIVVSTPAMVATIFSSEQFLYVLSVTLISF